MLCNNYTQQEYKSHHVIIPSNENNGALLLGDLNAATDQQIIKQYNIKTIITAACGLEHLKIPSELTHIIFPLMDTKQQNIAMYFELSNRTIEQNLKRGAVLVHCGAGISRSASLIIAYYMKKFNSNFKNAIGYVKKIKPNICPNLGFELQLKNYQNVLEGEKQEPKTHQIKGNRQREKQVSISSPYLFQIPLKTQNQTGFKNSQHMNRVFNKTHGQKIHQKPEKNKSELFIEGKNSQHKTNQIESNLSLYEPQKYTRKTAMNQRKTVSTAKKPRQDIFNMAFKF